MSGSRFQRPRGWQTAALALLVAVLLALSACGGQPEPQQPAAPSNVVATAGPGYVSVSWQDNSDNETGFEVYRTAGQTYSASATLDNAGFKLARATDITVANASAAGASLTWTTPAATVSHYVMLYRGDYEEYITYWA